MRAPAAGLRTQQGTGDASGTDEQLMADNQCVKFSPNTNSLKRQRRFARPSAVSALMALGACVALSSSSYSTGSGALRFCDAGIRSVQNACTERGGEREESRTVFQGATLYYLRFTVKETQGSV